MVESTRCLISNSCLFVDKEFCLRCGCSSMVAFLDTGGEFSIFSFCPSNNNKYKTPQNKIKQAYERGMLLSILCLGC